MSGWVAKLRERALFRWSLIVGGYLLAFFAMHYPLLGGERFLGWDAVNESWGDMVQGYRLLGDAALPLWNANERGGYPFMADPQTAVLYPASWLAYLGAALFGSGPWLALFRSLLHLLIGAAGLHFLLRRMRLPGAACWTGGLAFALCARMSKSKDNAGLWSAAWLPWLLIALDEGARRPSIRAGVALGFATAMTLLSGYPPNFFRCALAVLPVVIVLVGAEVARRPDRGAYLRGLAKAAVAAAIVVIGLTLPNVLATLELVPQTVRTGMRVAEVLRSSFYPQDLLNMVAPQAMHGHSFPYMGVLPLLLAALALVGRFEGRRLLYAAIAALFWLLSCGAHGVVLPALVEALPVFKLWRIPEQYLFVFAMFVALLAALGMADLIEADPARRRTLTWRAGAIVLVALGLAIFAYQLNKGRPGRAAVLPRYAPIVLVALSGAAMIGLLWVRRSWRPALAALAVGLLLIDLGLSLRPIYDILLPPPNLARDAQLATLAGLQQRSVRLADDEFFRYRVGVRRDVRELFGRRSTMVTERVLTYTNRARSSVALLEAANVRYYAGRQLRTIRAQAGARATLRGGVLELPDPAPRAFWTGRAEIVPQANAALGRLLRPGGWRTALVEGPQLSAEQSRRVAQLRGGPSAIVAATLAHEGRRRLSLEITAPAAGLLVVNETFYPGWQATVDGRPLQLLRANYLFSALPLEAGRHRVELCYRPTKIIGALALYGATLAGLLVLLVLALRARRAAA